MAPATRVTTTPVAATAAAPSAAPATLFTASVASFIMLFLAMRAPRKSPGELCFGNCSTRQIVPSAARGDRVNLATSASGRAHMRKPSSGAELGFHGASPVGENRDVYSQCAAAAIVPASENFNKPRCGGADGREQYVRRCRW